MEPHDYPWAGPLMPGILRAGEFEPNYDRVTVGSIGGSLRADLLLDPEEVDIYVSRHGVIDGHWRLGSQRDLFSRLAEHDHLTDVFDGDAADVCACLAAGADLRARVTDCLRTNLSHPTHRGRLFVGIRAHVADQPDART